MEALEQRLTEGVAGLDAGQQIVARGQARLVAKAWHDASFKQALLQDPKGVIEREFGEGLPAEVAVQVVAEDAHMQYLVLPPALADLELSDEQLEQVAGGEIAIMISWTVVTIALSAATASGAVSAGVTASVSYGHDKW